MKIPQFRVRFTSALPLALLALCAFPGAARAAGPDFSISSTTFTPSPMDQNTTATATLTLQSLNGFTGTVALQCTVTPQSASAPTCLVPQSVQPPAAPTVTLNASATSPAVLYTITVTGTSANTIASVSLTQNVVAVTPDYTITTKTSISPASLHAGSGATVVFNVTPVSYSGVVTPVCTSITPAVTLSPICTFNPATVTVSGSTVQTTTLTISTTGTSTATLSHRARYLWAVWLLLPGVLVCGSFSRKSHNSTLVRVATLAFLLALVILLPSCSSMYKTTNNNSSTPKNTYTITVSAVDGNLVAPSNGSTSATLTVN